MLIVEPNRNYLGVMARRLAEAGYRVATADSGPSGLRGNVSHAATTWSAS